MCVRKTRGAIISVCVRQQEDYCFAEFVESLQFPPLLIVLLWRMFCKVIFESVYAVKCFFFFFLLVLLSACTVRRAGLISSGALGQKIGMQDSLNKSTPHPQIPQKPISAPVSLCMISHIFG